MHETGLALQSEELSRALLEAAPDALVIVDREGIIRIVNGQAERIFGYKRSELSGQPIEKLIPHRYRDRHPKLRSAYARTPHTRPMGTGQELFGLRKDGSEFPVEISLSPLQTEGGLLTISAIRDISERKGMEQRFQAFLEAAPDAFVIADQSGKIVLVNAQTERDFGYERSELIGQAVETLIPHRFRKQHLHHRGDYSKSPHSRPMGAGRLLFGLRKNGSEFPVEISLSPVRTSEGLLVFSVIRDISIRRDVEAHVKQIESLNSELMSGRKALEEHNRQLEEANRELDEFTYVASHDLQEPLRKLMSFGKLLPMDLGKDLPEKAAEDLKFIIDAAGRMQALIQDLLQLSRARRSELALTTISLDECANRAIDILEDRIAESGAVIQRGQLGNVRGDRTLLTQLFQNLIGNAIKFRRSGNAPEIHLTKECQDGVHVFGVKDSGIGMKPEYLECIFAPFKRLHGREEYEGSGIGLAICRKVIDRHGGKIWVESEFGVGSHFRFSLPPAEE